MPRNRSEKAPPRPTIEGCPESLLDVLRVDAEVAVGDDKRPEGVASKDVVWASESGTRKFGELPDSIREQYNSLAYDLKMKFVCAHMEYLYATQSK